jgi:hypothetical protein
VSGKKKKKNINTLLLMRPPFAVVLYGCGARTLTLREDYRFSVFDDKVPRKIFGPKREMKWRGNREDCIMRNFVICNLRQILLGLLNQGGWYGQGM